MRRVIPTLVLAIMNWVAVAGSAGADHLGFLEHGAKALESRDYDGAIASASQVLAIDSKSADAYFVRGSAWIGKHEYDKGIADCNQAIRLLEGDAAKSMIAAVYSVRGGAWYNRGDFDKAMSDENFALANNPKLTAAYVWRAKVWKRKGESERAFSDYNQALAIDPKSANAYFGRGAICGEKREWDKALADYDLAITINPTYAEAYQSRADIHRRRGESERAITDCTQAIRYFDANETEKIAATYFYRGMIRHTQHQYDKAIADYNQALAIDSKRLDILCARGLAAEVNRDYEKAIGDYTRAQQIDPSGVDAYYRLAWLYSTCPNEKFRDGKKAFASILKAHPLSQKKDAFELATIAAVYAECGDFKLAMEWMQRAIDSAPNDKVKGEYRTYLDRFKQGKPCHP
jgi:tetratricopeptide (TPR) repeat protein